MPIYFLFFLISGFCGLVYEVVWLRLAMAQFGVTTPFVSMLLSIFMAGLALGSFTAGRLVRREQLRDPPLRMYALAELFIATSSVLVPTGLSWGRVLIEHAGGKVVWGSTAYYAVSGAWLLLVLLPFCTCMGATFPLAMAAIRNSGHRGAERSFSFLYLANVLGATLGTLTSAFVLIELYGFRGTLRAAGGLNASLAAAAMALSLTRAPRKHALPGMAAPPREGDRFALGLLFLSGLISMAMELVWTRMFTPFLGTLVYAFAAVLAIYLLATFAGSQLYRIWARRERAQAAWVLPWIGLIAAGLLPLWVTDPRLPLHTFGGGLVRVGFGLGPLCALLGFITPLLVDRWSGGDPRRAGSAYAVNVIGGIVGPLLAAFGLLPFMNERMALAVLSLPAALIGLYQVAQSSGSFGPQLGRRLWFTASLAAAILLLSRTHGYEDKLRPGYWQRRDYMATVTATGRGRDKHVMVNGIGMTTLTPITKMMVHLPMAMLPTPPRDVLVICFGMGTTFRSSLSWSVPTTVVELVPSIPKLVGYFHADGPDLLRNPLGQVVIDDGRRFLERSPAEFDVIAIDPPPPIEAAGSSLLYSREFYATAKKRLRQGGILQQWFPEAEAASLSAVTRALADSFPYVRAYLSIEGWGYHYLASMQPLPTLSPQELAARLPQRAAADLLEWGPAHTAEEQFRSVLARETPVQALIARAQVPAMQDDRPVNEYFLLRRSLRGLLDRRF